MASRHKSSGFLFPVFFLFFLFLLIMEVDGEVPINAKLQPMRISKDGNGIAGEKEDIESDILLPDTRIPSTPEVGSESNAGDITTEWNDTEQDEWFGGLFCNNWKELSSTKKELTLGDVTKSFSFFEKFPQKPVAWQHYKNEFINQLTMDFATDSFVKLTWNWMGANAPDMVDNFPLANVTPTFLDPLKTKSFITKKDMWLKIGDSIADLKSFRQSPSMSITISNNLERTPALGEDESIENSLGNFVIEGTLDSYNVDDTGKNLFNDANHGKDKVIQVSVSRKVSNIVTRYTLTLNVHLHAPTKSRNGNKYQFSVKFTVNADDNLSLVREILDENEQYADMPVFTKMLSDTEYNIGEEAEALDATATVTDGGTVTYVWKKDGVEVSNNAIIVPNTEDVGEFLYSVTATNTKNGVTSVSTQLVTITVSE